MATKQKKTIGSLAAKKKKKANSKKKDNKAAAAKKRAIQKRRKEEKSKAEKASKIGSFGSDLIFTVSPKKILPAKDWKRTQNGRWATHNIIGKAPRSEFQGPDRTETTLTVTFSAEYGVKPRHMISKVEKLIRKGTAEYLVLGGKIYGHQGHKHVITGASEAWETIFNKGELVKATMDLTFEEYW